MIRRLKKAAIFLFLVVILHGFVTSFLMVSLKIETEAMSPRYEPGYRVIASPLWYGPKVPFGSEHLPGLGRPKRGDLVVIRPPYIEAPSIVERLTGPFIRFVTGQKKSSVFGTRRPWENDFVVKRVIALPGDTVRMRGGEALVRSRGTPDFVSEFSISLARYEIAQIPRPEGWKDSDPLGGMFEDVELAMDEYFVLGDNRSRSTDSRLWGPIRENRIEAKVLFRYWPLGRMKKP